MTRDHALLPQICQEYWRRYQVVGLGAVTYQGKKVVLTMIVLHHIDAEMHSYNISYRVVSGRFLTGLINNCRARSVFHYNRVKSIQCLH
jgi:hypothetical protein